MSEKISMMEPAERVVTAALSKAELVALMRYHVAAAKAVPKRLGQASMKMADGYIPTAVELKAMRKIAVDLVEAHIARHKELSNLLEGVG